MSVTFFDRGAAVDFSHEGVCAEGRIICTKTHGAAFVVGFFSTHLVIALDPFFEVINDWGKTFLTRFMVKFFRARIWYVNQVSGGLYNSHLHAEADAQIWHLTFACKLRGLDFTLGSPLAKTTRY